jgi:hypothetical protein
MAQLSEGKKSPDTSHSVLPLPSSRDLVLSSPTLLAPVFSASSSASYESEENQSPTYGQYQIEGDHNVNAAVINPGDAVHAVWDDITTGNNEILYKRDGGDFDPSTVNLSNTPIISATPGIVVSGNDVYIIWQEDNEILFRKSNSEGGKFGQPISIRNVPNSDSPAIAVSGNNVHIVWRENFEIFYRGSTDGGTSFGNIIILSNNMESSANPAIAVSGDMVHVVWEDETPGNRDILYKRSTNGRASFTDPTKNLSNNLGFSSQPAVAVSGNNVHVVWADTTPTNNDTLYR